MRKLILIDIDETLFFTSAKILVKDKNNNIIKELTNKEFNNYKLRDNEHFDFIQFTKADIFVNDSKPNMKMINLVNKLQKDNEIALLTARPDFDNKEEILNFFKDYGLNVGHYKEGKIHIIRTGNMKNYMSVKIKKRIVTEKIILKRGFYNVELYDDSEENLKEFLKLKCLYPERNFKAFKVSENKIQEIR